MTHESPTNSNVENPAPIPATRDEPEVVTGIIRGDRVCIACGFNLCGQRIVREPRLNLLIARCPECGQAAALQEYPLLGRWANRWAATLAGLWLLGYIVLAIAAGMTIFGLAAGTTAVNSDALSHRIQLEYSEWLQANNPGTQRSAWSIDRAWWDGADHTALLEASGGARWIFWRSANTTWLGLLFSMVPIGCLASVALLGVPRRRLIFTALAPVVIACAASFIFIRVNVVYSGWTSQGADDLAMMLLWPWTFPSTIALGALFLIAGMLVGRPVARMLARTALPNRFVQALSVLWTSEGKAPPNPRR
ncbi:MAG: hypothetical protein H6813_05305 [Phycisphaeraceae bacterium]|nr:hypothetical protein [Phycisphaeraceae bacterium]MCB9847801.1 hypothetical protein [Phycisphaeraceae bacterium]